MKKVVVEKMVRHKSDQFFIDFCRCLYQAKAVVRELSIFSDSVYPALTIIPVNNIKDNGQLLKQVNQYLNTTFSKFNRLCHILLVVLTQMEEKNNVKRERIDSFRLEVWEEYKNATNIKKRLICFTQHDPQAAAMTTVAMKHDTMVTPTTATPNTTNNTNLNLNTHPLTHLTLN